MGWGGEVFGEGVLHLVELNFRPGEIKGVECGVVKVYQLDALRGKFPASFREKIGDFVRRFV